MKITNEEFWKSVEAAVLDNVDHFPPSIAYPDITSYTQEEQKMYAEEMIYLLINYDKAERIRKALVFFNTISKDIW